MLLAASGNAQPAGGTFLSPADAKERAKVEFLKNIWAFPKELALSIKGTKADDPLLVQRIDRKDSFYYIIPFSKGDTASCLVILDAKTGRFKEASRLSEPSRYPQVNQEEAKRYLTEYLKKEKGQTSVAITKAEWVWEPSEQTQSAYVPLLRIQTRAQTWFVDQNGKVYEKIIPIKLKGGMVRNDLRSKNK